MEWFAMCVVVLLVAAWIAVDHWGDKEDKPRRRLETSNKYHV